MKKTFVIATVLILTLLGSSASFAATLRVGATPIPHAEILNVVVPILEDAGIGLDIVEFTDYLTPNLALQEGELDANFFQHIPYLESFNEDSGADLVALVGVHVEPLGIYSHRYTSLEALPTKATIAIPNDVTNGGRALLLLQAAGLIALHPEAGSTPTVFDIRENKGQIRFVELEAAQLTRSLPDVDAAIINGNYALQANLNPATDALFLEGAESPYVNILAVRADDKDNPLLLKLAEALVSVDVRDFIIETYDGSIVPVF